MGLYNILYITLTMIKYIIISIITIEVMNRMSNIIYFKDKLSSKNKKNLILLKEWTDYQMELLISNLLNIIKN
jgi:hypothetical protein